MLLQGKKIVLGISGSIAAYKTPELVRQFVKKGAEVQVILTDGGRQFVTPLALATVSRREVMLSMTADSQWHNHVALGLWADLFIIAPCSANLLGKMANGLCDNMLLATYLSARCEVAVAPAMDLDMWRHPAVQNNVNLLKANGNYLIEPESGELASGLSGQGRMAAPENIVAWAERYFYQQQPPQKTALVTAGPTYEAIDPVRFIGNHSTGKMGIALAEALADSGYNVKLILGPSSLTATHPAIETIRVTDAASMYEASHKYFPEVSVAVLAAAVADFTPETTADQKIKKGADTTMQLHLTQTRDILASLGKIKSDTQKLVGFALETQNALDNAKAKLERKNADHIVLNTLQDAGAGFGHDTNKVVILDRNGQTTELPLQSKKDIARAIAHHILTS